MARSTLAERMNRLEQQKARLAEEEARIRDQERKQRTRRLIETGGLVDKAGLLDLEPNALLGALIAIKAEAARPEVLARWAAEGGKVFAREAAEKGRVKEALIVVFPKPIARELTGTAARHRAALEQGAPALGRPGRARRGVEARRRARRNRAAGARRRPAAGRRRMIARARSRRSAWRALELGLSLAPLALAGFAHAASTNLWGEVVAILPAGSPAQALAWSAWPTAQLSGSLLLLAGAILAKRADAAGRLAVIAALLGLAAAVGLTAWPEIERLAELGPRFPGRNSSPVSMCGSRSPARSGSSALRGACASCAEPARMRRLRPEPSSARRPTISDMPTGWRSPKRVRSSPATARKRAASSSARPTGSTRTASAHRPFDPRDSASLGTGRRRRRC